MTPEGEILSTPLDRKKAESGLPRHRAARKNGGPSRAALWVEHETLHPDPPPVFGSYPKNFIPWVARMLHAKPSDILHVCSGGLRRGDGGIRIDLRLGQLPDIVADGRHLPFADGTFPAVLLDPPYSVELAAALYGTEYPRPSHLLREACRVARPGSRFGMLHFLVPHSPRGSRLVVVRGVTQGCGYRIRALTVFQKDQDGLFSNTAHEAEKGSPR